METGYRPAMLCLSSLALLLFVPKIADVRTINYVSIRVLRLGRVLVAVLVL